MKSYGDPAKYIHHMYVEEDCLEYPLTKEIMERSRVPIDVIASRQTPAVSGEYPDNLSEGKHHLLLCKNRGNFFKPCPGTREYQCCGYQVLGVGMNCPMDCVYCILQAYLNNPWLSFFVNIDQLFEELDQAFAQEPSRFFRIGTGEFTDSLALDSLTGLSRHLVTYMADKKNAVLELKTKSVVIENLQDLDHNGRTVVAWSLNSPAIMEKEEIRTASLEERLEAAAQCAQWGYKLAFHFDPIILHDGWQEGYCYTIDRLFATVPADKIVWISLGALRYLPALKKTACSRFPASRFFYQEFITGLDNKARYFRDVRVELYRVLVAALQERAANSTCIYFCMESDVIWQEIFGYCPEEKGGLSNMLDLSCQDR